MSSNGQSGDMIKSPDEGVKLPGKYEIIACFAPQGSQNFGKFKYFWEIPKIRLFFLNDTHVGG